MVREAESCWEMPEYLRRCPTCGRFVNVDEGFYDVEPGGHRGHDYCEVYCDAECAERMDPPALCEDHAAEHCPEPECRTVGQSGPFYE